MALSMVGDPGGGDNRCSTACSCDRAMRAEAALAASTASAAALQASLNVALGKAEVLTRQLKAAERAAAVATGGALPVSSSLLRGGGSGSWSHCSELSQPTGRVGADAAVTAAASVGAAVPAMVPSAAVAPEDVEMRSCTAADGLLLLSRAGAASVVAATAVTAAPVVAAPVPVVPAAVVPAAAAVPVVPATAVTAPTPAPLVGAVRKSRTAASSSKRPTASKSRFSSASGPTQSRYWTAEEHARFLEALRRYGHKDLKAIAAAVATRNQTQARTHLQKWLMKIAREARRSEAAAAAAAAANGEASTAPDVKTQASSVVNIPAKPDVAAVTEATPASVAEADEAAASATPGGGGNACAVPLSCGMALLCIVGQDTLRV